MRKLTNKQKRRNIKKSRNPLRRKRFVGASGGPRSLEMQNEGYGRWLTLVARFEAKHIQ